MSSLYFTETQPKPRHFKKLGKSTQDKTLDGVKLLLLSWVSQPTQTRHLQDMV